MTRAHGFRVLLVALLAACALSPSAGGASVVPVARSAAHGGMVVALDTGGWGGPAYFDIGRAVKAVRLGSRHATDAEVGSAARAGVSIASWLVNAHGSVAAIDPQRYAAEVVALFKRYGKGGSFWRGRHDLGGRAVEVLNEPANPYIWRDAGDARAYVRLLRTVHAALAASFPAAIRPRVLASWDGGWGPSSGFGTNWKALGGVAYCEGVTVHAYAGARTRYGPQRGRAAVQAAWAASGKPVYVTEVGWPTAVGRSPTGDSLQMTETEQADNLTSFFRWARSTGYVRMTTYFNYVDYGSNYWYGIERRNRSHKPAFAALARLTAERG
jgi:hypothetical protein